MKTKTLLMTLVFALSSPAFASFGSTLPNLSDLDKLHENAKKAVGEYAMQNYGLEEQNIAIGYIKKKNSFFGKRVFLVLDLVTDCTFQADARVNFKKGNWKVVEIPNTNTCL